MTGDEHVSQQYHLNPAGSKENYRHSGCSEMSDPRFFSSFVNFDDGFRRALLFEYVDLRYSPAYVIIDSGCTRATGSRTAIMRLVKACKRHYNSSKIDFSFEPSSSRFSFANGEQSNVREKLVIYFQNDQAPTGWIST